MDFHANKPIPTVVLDYHAAQNNRPVEEGTFLQESPFTAVVSRPPTVYANGYPTPPSHSSALSPVSDAQHPTSQNRMTIQDLTPPSSRSGPRPDGQPAFRANTASSFVTPPARQSNLMSPFYMPAHPPHHNSSYIPPSETRQARYTPPPAAEGYSAPPNSYRNVQPSLSFPLAIAMPPPPPHVLAPRPVPSTQHGPLPSTSYESSQRPLQLPSPTDARSLRPLRPIPSLQTSFDSPHASAHRPPHSSGPGPVPHAPSVPSDQPQSRVPLSSVMTDWAHRTRQLEEENVRLSNELRQAEKVVSTLQEQRRQIESNAAQEAKQFAQYKAENEAAQAQLRLQRQITLVERERSRNECDMLRAQLAPLETSLFEHTAELAAHRSDAAVFRRLNAQLMGRVRDLHAMLAIRVQQAERLTWERDEFKAQLVAMNSASLNIEAATQVKREPGSSPSSELIDEQLELQYPPEADAPVASTSATVVPTAEPAMIVKSEPSDSTFYTWDPPLEEDRKRSREEYEGEAAAGGGGLDGEGRAAVRPRLEDDEPSLGPEFLFPVMRALDSSDRVRKSPLGYFMEVRRKQGG
ncbi:hypothetical protein R3P38DRAFT_3171092 [Favolaschia claudopus]|uniref:Uncharacterized protein n=1 Tax=Favolaschia claudopus TaxID=2862362 RepID=A0AAW0DPQ3_9AGAR